jgi:hypothetical protein
MKLNKGYCKRYSWLVRGSRSGPVGRLCNNTAREDGAAGRVAVL